MVVLLTGASGFIGKHLTSKFTAAGYTVIEARRHSTHPTHVTADFTRDLSAQDWLPKLRGVDCVINAVGIIREHGKQTFERVHSLAPQALFEACAQARVRRVIQISALGADHGESAYFRSKRAADEHLAKLPLEWTIVQPSLVYGHGGTSARLFGFLASLPIVPLPGRGDQLVQPIHIDDAVDAIFTIVAMNNSHGERVALVGPRSLMLREFLGRLRAALGFSAPRFLPLPIWLMRLSARIAQLNPRSLLDRETLAMLEAGNTADPSATTKLLNRPPRGVENFVDTRYREVLAHDTRMTWLLPLLRFSIAVVWIWTGIVSFGLYPIEESYALLARVGIGASLAPLFLYGAAVLDLAFGIATLALRRRRTLWLLQVAVILGYTAIITLKLPEFWLHPYGPLLKNLPMVAAIYMMYVLEER